jgi:hypothetical protein
MGTISDKLMRIINTKEDIRQALISKGYDVPTSIPFKEYAKMILDLPCKVDSFPDIEGIVARYSASGLTNEQMAANPVWVDKTGNGHDLQLKNFAWKGMSGVGRYVADIDEWGTNSMAAYFERNSIKITATFKENVSLGLLYHNIKLRQSCVLKVTGIPEGCDAFLDDRLGNRFYMSEDGVYEIIPSNFLAEALYFSIEKYPERWYGSKLTIEQLPLYPGALVFDGVDDWAGCDNLPLLPKEKGYSIIALRNWITRYDATQYKRPLISNLDTNDEGAFLIEYRKDENVNDVTGSYNSFTDVYIDDNNPITWQTSSSYNGQIIKKGTSKSTNKLCICKTYFGQLSNYANAAIWEIVILDHDATEEELTKIKDYFVKTYPWLFPDQAWTVTGKTNEDEDRATIANITGNGNNLVLSNLGFIEGSGYNKEGEYAGYLVTDGVDDKITSSIFEMGNDWTVIGDWELINTGKKDNAGIVKFDSIVIYNYNSILINIKNGRNNLIPDQNTVNAICSDGRIYSKDWKESIYNEETESTSKNFLTIGYSGNAYTKIAFKNLAIYPTVLSREDCIKAYNYLQTLKAK